MAHLSAGLKQGLLHGARKGAGSFVWLCKIIVPVSLLMTLLHWTGWLYALDFLFKPVMGWLNLPPIAALPVLTSVFAGFYPALAVVATIPFTPHQLILLAIFLLTAHGLLIEGVIQHKSGINLFKIGLIRLLTASLTVVVVSQFFEATDLSPAGAAGRLASPSLAAALTTWAAGTGRLCLKILVIVMVIMIGLETFTRLGWMQPVVRVFHPCLAVLGLPRGVATMWLAGVLFGLSYSSAVIVEEARAGNLKKDELERLHISIGINHSLVEDPALFLALGVGLFWTIVPRLAAAVAVVHAYRGVVGLRARSRRRLSA